MIRILHVLGSRPTGGVGAFLYNYHQYIDKSKVQFDYLMFSDFKSGDYDEKVKKLGGRVYVLPALKHKRLLLLHDLLIQFFAKHASEYNIVHLHTANLAFLVLKVAKKYGIEVRIIHAHATVYSEKYLWKSWRNKVLWYIGKKYATNYCACSKAAGEFYYGKEAVNSGLAKIVPNAIDLEKYKFNKETRDKIRKSLNIENKFVIGHIGRMSPLKNQIFLLKIFADLKRLNNNTVLLIIGDGPLRKQLEEEIIKLNLVNSIILLGVRNDVPNFLTAMDVFVLPSLFEGLGIVVMEAQASGLKCILSDKVPVETNMGGAEYISLTTSSIEWAKRILNVKFLEKRESYIKNLEENGYSIKLAVKDLEEYYENFNCKG